MEDRPDDDRAIMATVIFLRPAERDRKSIETQGALLDDTAITGSFLLEPDHASPVRILAVWFGQVLELGHPHTAHHNSDLILVLIVQ